MRYVAEITSEKSFALTQHAQTFEIWEYFTSRELSSAMFDALTQTKDENLWQDVKKNVVIFIDDEGQQSRQVKPWMDLNLKEQYFPIEGTLPRKEFWARQRVEEGLYKFLDIYCAWVTGSYDNYVNTINCRSTSII